MIRGRERREGTDEFLCTDVLFGSIQIHWRIGSMIKAPYAMRNNSEVSNPGVNMIAHGFLRSVEVSKSFEAYRALNEGKRYGVVADL